MIKSFFIISIVIFIIYAFVYPFSLITLIYAFMLSILLSITAVDLNKKLIPNQLILLIFILGVCNLFLNIENYKLFLYGFLLASAFSLFIYILSKKKFGGGDVKLISSLGLLLGSYNVYFMLLIAFTLSVVVGLIMIAKKKATLKTSMPFGPFIALSVLLLIFF